MYCRVSYSRLGLESDVKVQTLVICLVMGIATNHLLLALGSDQFSQLLALVFGHCAIGVLSDYAPFMQLLDDQVHVLHCFVFTHWLFFRLWALGPVTISRVVGGFGLAR